MKNDDVENTVMDYLMIRVILAGILIYFIVADINLTAGEWYSNEVFFSDWRGTPHCDYSTNAIVTQWYTKQKTKYLRHDNEDEIDLRLLRGDTLSIGLDYYSLFGISIRLVEKYFTMEFIQRAREPWLNGETLAINIFYREGRMYYFWAQ